MFGRAIGSCILTAASEVFRSTETLCSRSQIVRYCSAKPIVKWDLYAAVCLERQPVVTKPKTEMEERFHKMLKQIELENSMKSDHELLLELERKQQEFVKRGITEAIAEETTKDSALDLEDFGQQELDSFEFAPRITEADKNGVTNTTDRKLDRNLILIVKQKIGDSFVWIPPQGPRKDGETMRQTAERVLQDTCSDKITAKFYGNAPVGFYKYRYPKELRETGVYGAKVFFYLARYLKGEVPSKVDYQWLDQEEMKKIIHPRVHKSMSQFLIPDENVL